jgi:hypothetical protein
MTALSKDFLPVDSKAKQSMLWTLIHVAYQQKQFVLLTLIFNEVWNKFWG